MVEERVQNNIKFEYFVCQESVVLNNIEFRMAPMLFQVQTFTPSRPYCHLSFKNAELFSVSRLLPIRKIICYATTLNFIHGVPQLDVHQYHLLRTWTTKSRCSNKRWSIYKGGSILTKTMETVKPLLYNCAQIFIGSAEFYLHFYHMWLINFILFGTNL